MRRFIYLTTALLLTVFLVGKGSPQEEYIAKYSGIAVSEMKRTGVPASITLAQGILESSAGRSFLAVKGNNHFGIKCHKDWKGKKTFLDDDKEKECFRVYPNVEASYKDHSDFLRYRDRYKALFELSPTDYKGWARGLKKAGYATDPQYANKLISVIEEYKLYKFDDVRKEDLPIVSPLEAEKEHRIEDVLIREEIKFSTGRQIYVINGVPFVRVMEGESLKEIADYYDLFYSEILRFNDLSAAEAASVAPGTVVYIQAKKSKAARGLDKYVVGEDGESLRELSQRFGIRLKSLLKLNKLSADHKLSEGETLKLR